MEYVVGQVKIELSSELCETLKVHIQSGDRPEAGGVLLGKYIPEEQKYVIKEASTPGKFDKWGKYFFVRKRKPAQKLINKRWKESSGIVNYLGEWHTHGCDFPVPSETDKDLIRMIFTDQSNVWPNIIMIILGRKSCYIGISEANSRGEITCISYIEGAEYAQLFNR